MIPYRWNDTGHEYELLLTNTTLVVPALIRNLPGGDPNVSFNFVKFKNLKPIKEVNDSILETKVDVIGRLLLTFMDPQWSLDLKRSFLTFNG